MTTYRQTRQDNRHRNQLRCENCNRWTNVEPDLWSHTIRRLRERGDEYLFLCDRRRCKLGRPENLLSGLDDYQKRKVLYAKRDWNEKDGN